MFRNPSISPLLAQPERRKRSPGGISYWTSYQTLAGTNPKIVCGRLKTWRNFWVAATSSLLILILVKCLKLSYHRFFLGSHSPTEDEIRRQKREEMARLLRPSKAIPKSHSALEALVYKLGCWWEETGDEMEDEKKMHDMPGVAVVLMCAWAFVSWRVSNKMRSTPYDIHILRGKWWQLRYLKWSPCFLEAGMSLLISLLYVPMNWIVTTEDDTKEMDFQMFLDLVGDGIQILVPIYVFVQGYFSEMICSGRLYLRFPVAEVGPKGDSPLQLAKLMSFQEYFYSFWRRKLTFLLLIFMCGFTPNGINWIFWKQFSLWTYIFWIILNLITGLTESALINEVGFPLISDTRNIYHGPVIHISDGMCVEDEECLYLRQLACYEFLRAAKDNEKAVEFFKISRQGNAMMKYSSGFDQILDASFWLIDNFREKLHIWLQGQGVVIISTTATTETANPTSENHLNRLLSKKNELAADGKIRRLGDCGPNQPLINNEDVLIPPTIDDLSFKSLFILFRLFILRKISNFMGQIEKRLEVIMYIRNYVIGFILSFFLDPKELQDQYQLTLMLLDQQEILVWTMEGLLELTCKSLDIDRYGQVQPCVELISVCFLDLEASLGEASKYLEKLKEDGDRYFDEKTKHQLQKNLTTMNRLLHCSKFCVGRLHHTFKDYYKDLNFPQELKIRMIMACH